MAVSEKDGGGRRRWLIGGNVALTIVIVWVVVVLVNVLVDDKAPAAWDWTHTGQFSLSSRTTKLLEGLSEPVVLTALYDVEEGDEQGREQSRRVADLLRRYAGVSGKVSYEVLDPRKDTGAKTALIKRLTAAYAGEATKHKQVVKDFEALAPTALALLDDESKQIEKLAEQFPKLINANPNMVAIYRYFKQDRQNVEMSVNEVTERISGGDIPRYSSAVELIEKVLDSVKTHLTVAGEYLGSDGAKIEGLDEGTRKLFAGAPDRYKPVLKVVSNVLKEHGDLPKLELEAIYDQVRFKHARTIVVEAGGKAKVLTYADVWPSSRQQMATTGKQTAEFNGEAVVSSAILGLTMKEKSAVIFVHAGPPSPIKPGFAMMQMTRPLYQLVKEKLEETNFIVEDWDILARATPPEISEAKRKVYVIMPPEPPGQGGPMRRPTGYEQTHVDLIEKQLLDSGAPVLFLAKFSPVMMGMGGTPYPFTELLKKRYGVTVEAAKLVVRGIMVGDDSFGQPWLELDRYPSHAITDPIQTLASMFPEAVPIEIDATLSEGITVEPLVTVDDDLGDCWGESNLLKLMQGRRAEKDKDDTSPPFYLGVVVTDANTKGKVVIFGNAIFAADPVARGEFYLTSRGSLAYRLPYPGNLELFANSTFWLNDNKNLIAVGPRRAEIPRIAAISPGGLLVWKVVFWAVLPLMALASGGLVYLVRRK